MDGWMYAGMYVYLRKVDINNANGLNKKWYAGYFSVSLAQL